MNNFPEKGTKSAIPRKQIEMAKTSRYYNRLILVFVVNEKESMRGGLRTILEETSGFQIVGQADISSELLPLLSMPVVDMVLWRLSSEQTSIWKEYQRMEELFPKANVMLLACKTDGMAVHTISQTAGTNRIVHDITVSDHTARLRQLALDAHVVDMKPPTRNLQKVKPFLKFGDIEELGSLSKREQRAAALIAKGQTNKEIARTMNLSENTIKNYVSNIIEKLNVTRRTQIAPLFSSGLL